MAKLDNTHLIKISLLGFLICFAIVYYVEINFTPPLINIENITSSDLNHHITIRGEIITQRISSNTLFVKVKDETGIIDVILFKSNHTLEKNKEYIIEGKVGYYKDNFQLIAKNIYLKF